MMSKPVEVISPEFGGRFDAIVVIKPEHETPDSLKLTINIKEIPTNDSLIPGEEFIVPATKKIESKSKNDTTSSNDNATVSVDSKTKRESIAKKSKGE